jgi:hypothetical protein
MGKRRLHALALGTGLAALVFAGAYLASSKLRHEVGSIGRAIADRDRIGIWRTDAVLGFRHVPGAAGTHDVPEAFRVTYHIDDRGNRVTPDPARAEREVLVLGCSWTFGHGVEDEQAWPYLLGLAWSEAKVHNGGAMAYGTAHAWLLLREELERAPPALVIYAFSHHHQRRNYLRRSWLRSVAEWGRLHPHVELEDGALVARGAVGMEAAVSDDDPGLAAKERELTRAMIADMRELCARAGTSFVVVNVNAGGLEVLAGLEGLRVVDVAHWDGDLELRIPHDYHPNAEWHRRVAAKLAEDLR